MGGGALVFNNLRNSNNNQSTINGDNNIGRDKNDITNTTNNSNIDNSRNSSSPITNNNGESTVNNEGNTTNNLSETTASNSEQSSSSETSQPGKIDIKSDNMKWGLKYPVYQKQNNNCVLVGNSSIKVTQLKGGSLGYGGDLNGYGFSNIQGTITSSGIANLSINSSTGYFVSLESENAKINPSDIFITGKATAPGCKDSTFELRKL